MVQQTPDGRRKSMGQANPRAARVTLITPQDSSLLDAVEPSTFFDGNVASSSSSATHAPTSTSSPEPSGSSSRVSYPTYQKGKGAVGKGKKQEVHTIDEDDDEPVLVSSSSRGLDRTSSSARHPTSSARDRRRSPTGWSPEAAASNEASGHEDVQFQVENLPTDPPPTYDAHLGALAPNSHSHDWGDGASDDLALRRQTPRGWEMDGPAVAPPLGHSSGSWARQQRQDQHHPLARRHSPEQLGGLRHGSRTSRSYSPVNSNVRRSSPATVSYTEPLPAIDFFLRDPRLHRGYDLTQFTRAPWTSARVLAVPQQPLEKDAVSYIWTQHPVHYALREPALDTHRPYLPLGTVVSKQQQDPLSPAPAIAGEPLAIPVDQVDGEAAVQKEDTDTVMEGAESQGGGEPVALSPAAAAAEEVEEDAPPVPSKSPVINTTPAPEVQQSRIVSQFELDNMNPMDHMYFDPEAYCWKLFYPLVGETRMKSLPPCGQVWHCALPTPSTFPEWLQLPEILPPAYATGAFDPDSGQPDPTKAERYVHEENALKERMRHQLRVLKDLADNEQLVAISTGDEWYPTIIPLELKQEIEKMRMENPPPGETPARAQYQLWATLWKMLDNLLFRGEARPVKTTNTLFTKWIGWDGLFKQIAVGCLGMRIKVSASFHALVFPTVDETNEGRLNRRRLLRCWLETALWLEAHPVPAGMSPYTATSRIQLRPVEPELLKALGGISAEFLQSLDKATDAKVIDRKLLRAYDRLGTVPNMRGTAIMGAYELLAPSFSEQLPWLFDAFATIAEARADARTSGHDDMLMAMVTARSEGSYTRGDIASAYQALNQEPDWGDAVDEETLGETYNTLTSAASADDLAHYRRSLELIARHRNNPFLKAILNTSAENIVPDAMTLQQAYNLLDVNAQTDDEMLMLVYEMRVSDSPGESNKFKEALKTIATERKSSTLMALADPNHTAEMPWPTAAQADPTRPLGLTNIANTCYLNSLLQYIFTVRELRDTIAEFSATGAATPVEAQVETERRVGGRVVSRREIERSRRFVHLLQGLFTQLQHSQGSAVTPETELAYLALVPSREEPEELGATISEGVDSKVEKPAVLAAPATIVTEEPASMDTSNSPSPSVLGKRTNEHLDGEPGVAAEDVMDTDGGSSQRAPLAEKDVNQASRSLSAPIKRTTSNSRWSESDEDETRLGTATMTEMTAVETPDGVTEILPVLQAEKPAPPPLPPRPVPRPKAEERQKTLESQVQSYMAYGKQNDVTECMDNVLFQLEAALEPSLATADTPSGVSVVKRLFYGNMKQALEINDPNEKEPLRVKEEPFSYLLVDVAAEGQTLYDGLDNVFDDSTHEIEGKPARRRITLLDVPSILQIQLQRVQYDRDQQRIFKSNAYMKYDRTLALDRYLEADPNDAEAVARREKTSRCRAELEQIRNTLAQHKVKTSNPVDALRESAKHFARLTQDPRLEGPLAALRASIHLDIVQMSEEEADALSADFVALEKRVDELRAELDAIWAGHEKYVFELVSVFMHRGTAQSGHYYIFQRNSKDPSKWLKYNDSQIADIDPDVEVFAPTTGDASPYFLAWVRKDTNAIDSASRGS